MHKVYKNAPDALKDLLHNNMTIMAGGFGLCGIPENCINAIKESGVKDLTVISNNCGVDDFGLGILLKNKQIKKMISSYVGENKIFEKQLLSGELAVDLVPQGTLAEKIRAGGAGIPAFYTKTGCGTVVADGKEVKIFGDQEYIMEHSLYADLAIIKCWKADTDGNLVYRKTARNFNPIMATAAKITIVEAEEIVEVGSLDADSIHTPSIYTKRMFVGHFEKRIERLTLATANEAI